MAYNAAMFGLYENLFLVLKNKLGERKAVDLFRTIITAGLKKSYDANSFEKGNPKSFAQTVKKRDESVGVEVKFPIVTDRKIVYQFWTDPFPNLKGKVDPHTLDDTYMHFKVSYLLGDNWTYNTTKHFWRGDACTEHVIEKK